MPPTKLTAQDKAEILKEYRNTDVTTSVLGNRYSVSSSSISRFLQKALSREEYDLLIDRRRANRVRKSSADRLTNNDSPSSTTQLSLFEPTREKPILKTEASPETTETSEKINVISLEEMLAEELGDIYDDEPDDSEGNGDSDDPEEIFIDRPENNKLQVLPLGKAPLAQTCYVVIHKISADLITRQLKVFGELGQIPPTEANQMTLPIFDSHQVAKRFSRGLNRVVKIPDGRLISKTSNYLTAKGITRILLNGEVFALEPSSQG